MANDIEPIAPTEILPAEPTPNSDTLATLKQQVEAMGAARELATVLCNTGMVPQHFRGKPDDGAAAILYGTELGLNPMQSLQNVFVVHGTPAVYARTMAALLTSRGYRISTIESTDEAVTVTANAPDGATETSTWTIDRAKKAGYTTNKKYTTDPQAMLFAKATAEVCRKIAPHILLGIQYSYEELQIDAEQERRKVKATRVDKPAGRLAAAAATTTTETVDVDSIIAAFAAATNSKELDAVVEQARAIPTDHPQHAAALDAYNQRLGELQAGNA